MATLKRPAILLALFVPFLVFAGPRGSTHGGGHTSSKSHATSTYRSSNHSTPRPKSSAPKHSAPPSSPGVKRDSKGKIQRSATAKSSFRKGHPCPSTGKTSGRCPGYEVDHRVPVACGGSDSPSNMQWLSKNENRLKGSQGCRRR